ncbi:hypothetical protein [Mycobacteroides abscessus]|uniref:hypothetical protein n=1 Tax=Mycobacteroides abscessus TaxID=36809 RepID=UPI0005E8EC90|nr:hypothetical protein [Mycobacteroides abscessus]MBE5511305.1 hypothetical protein [Mycobacteroides abscessus]MDB2190903.1 hypothetical protein [Mycobacteroides abscessus subsp. abscessus]MDM2470110.1 hypothetical protein [Mycobacteroides abscessus]MDM2477507.1 hypothetical protein [Mycobacteroides abscessus]MDM2480357.1 hypothetical protein [Mycobacteroides abscessus]
MAATVEHVNLDEQPVEIVGEYLTVSAVSSWVIQRGDGDNDTLTVKIGRIDPGQTRGLAVGDRVRVNATMKVETTPGGNTKPLTQPNGSKNSPGVDRSAYWSSFSRLPGDLAAVLQLSTAAMMHKRLSPWCDTGMSVTHGLIGGRV